MLPSRTAGRSCLIVKSMGGRAGCHLSLQKTVAAVVCLGDPLCGGGDCSKPRDKLLRDLSTPILFVQGTRDSLCPAEVFEGARGEIQAVNGLHVVEGGDHSLPVTKSCSTASGKTQDYVDKRDLRVIQKLVARDFKTVC
jgi:uncharacterized protein